MLETNRQNATLPIKRGAATILRFLIENEHYLRVPNERWREII
jgi:hypothetical protein